MHETTTEEVSEFAKIIEELGAFICDKVCDHKKMLQLGCNQNCKLEEYLTKLQAEYDRINNFDNSQSYKIMQQTEKAKKEAVQKLDELKKDAEEKKMYAVVLAYTAAREIVKGGL